MYIEMSLANKYPCILVWLVVQMVAWLVVQVVV